MQIGSRITFILCLVLLLLQTMTGCTGDQQKQIEQIDEDINQGDYYLQQGQPDMAIAEYNKAIELDPDKADMYYK